MRTVDYIPSGEGPGDSRPPLADPPAPKGNFGPESDLLAVVRAGDPQATAVLYERYRRPGLRFISSLMAGSQDAEDVFHDAFAKAVGAIRNGYGPTDIFGAYLNTAIRSVANTFWKNRPGSSRHRRRPGSRAL